MVKFNEIEIIEFPIILGDHPSCQDGPAIQMGSSCQSRIILDVEEYEVVRSCCRRRSNELVLTCEERCQRLQRNGIKIRNINKSNKSSSSTKNKKKKISSSSSLSIKAKQHEQRLCDINDQLEELMARLDTINVEVSKRCDATDNDPSTTEQRRSPPTRSARSDRGRVTLMARCA